MASLTSVAATWREPGATRATRIEIQADPTSSSKQARAPAAVAATTDGGEQAGQDPLQHDAPGEVVVAGPVEQPPEHLVVGRRRRPPVPGRGEDVVEVAGRAGGHPPGDDGGEHVGPATEGGPLLVEAGRQLLGGITGERHGPTVRRRAHRSAHRRTVSGRSPAIGRAR